MVLFRISNSEWKPGFQAPKGSKSDFKNPSKQTNGWLWIYVSFCILCDAQKVENVIFIIQEQRKDLELNSDTYLQMN